jgi:hypothetical protein
MESFNEYIQKYKNQLNRGYIQKAYKGIINSITSLKNYLEKKHPDYGVSSL